MANVITVGISDFKIASNSDSLITYALGSCVGICLFDPTTKIAGMSHILLPCISPTDNNKMKYADTAIPLLVESMEQQNVKRSNLVAKIAGGASMFTTSFSNSALAQIGTRNVESVKKALASLNIPIIAEATGGNQGRTIKFDSDTGDLHVRSVPNAEYII